MARKGRAKSFMELNYSGFDDFLEKIKEMGKDVDKAAEKATKANSQTALTCLVHEARKSGVPEDIIRTAHIKTDMNRSHGYYHAEVGWDKGAYDPKNPSDAYKVIFMNYGTVRRKTRQGYNRGAVPAPNSKIKPLFIKRAKAKAKRVIRKEQQELLDSIIRHYKGGGK